MKHSFGSIVENTSSTFAKSIFGLFNLFAHADEDPSAGDPKPKENTTTPPQTTGSTINYEDLIAKARKEEKAKLYNELERLKGQIATLTEQHNADLLKVADLEQKLSNAEKASQKDESEEVKTLKAEIEKLNGEKKDAETKLSEIKKNTISREEVEKEVREELEKEYAVKEHKAQILAEHKEDLLLPELVIGSTVEELDASLASAIERSNKIREQLGVNKKPEEAGAPTPNIPKSNPSTDRLAGSGYSLEKIASLDPSSPEYKEFRKKMGLR